MNARSLTRWQAHKSLWDYRDALLLLIVAAVAIVWWWPIGSPLRQTNRDLDLAIFGDGYFQVKFGSQITYTRKGRLNLNANGEICFGNPAEDRLLEPTITIPQDAGVIHFLRTGNVGVEQAGSDQRSEVGVLQMARFVNPGSLKEISPGFFAATDESGAPIISDPGVDGMGLIRQRWLEGSSLFENADSTSILLAILCGCIGWLFLEVRSLRRRLSTAAEPEPVTLKFPASSSALTQRREAA